MQALLPQENAGSLKLSTYVHMHPVGDGHVGLYHPFGHEVTFLSEEQSSAVAARQYDKVPAFVLNDLVQRRFLVQPGYDENVLNDVIVAPIKGFINLWLLVVQTCNMGCSYCVVEADEQTRRIPILPELSQISGGRMTPEVARAALAVFRRSLERHQQPLAKVTIYGGEPLLNKKLLFEIIPEIRALDWPGRQAPVEILCFTNGLTYDAELTALFRANDVCVGLSLDGKKHHHDSTRKKLDGSGTFDTIVANYQKYRDAGVAIGISCTIGSHNVDDLPEIVDYFINELHAPSIQLQTPIQMPGSKNPRYVNMEDAAASALAAFKKCREAGVDEGLAMRRISRFVDGKFHHRDCFAVGGELAVSPDGTTGPCHNATIGASQYFRGNVRDPNFDPERGANFTEWHARMPVNMPGCHGCSFIGLCGGGCPYNALVMKGSIWEKDPQQCGYMENFVNWLLEDIWQRFSDMRTRPIQGQGALQASATGRRPGLGH